MLHATCTQHRPPSALESPLPLPFPSLLGSARVSSQLDSGQALIFMRMLRVLYARRRCLHVNDNTMPHTHKHTLSHTHTRMAQQPPAHAHLHTQVQLHSGLDGIKAAPGRDSSWLETQPESESEPEPVHCADLQRNEICFIMQNANTPARPSPLPHTVSVSTVCAHITHTPRATLLCHKKCRQQTTVKTYTHTHTRTSNELAKGVA